MSALAVMALSATAQDFDNTPTLNINNKEKQVKFTVGARFMADAAYYNTEATPLKSGATISGTVTGIEIRAGELTLDGCTVTGGNGVVTAAYNGNGATVANAAIAISQHTTKLPVSVTIKGGTYTGSAALYQANTLTDKTDFDDITLSVTGGTFTGEIESDNKTGFISKPESGDGPLFSAKPDDSYCALGYTTKMVEGSNLYGLTERDEDAAMFDADGKLLGYEDVANAVNNANAVTIKLIKNATANGVVLLGKTLDLNGFTLTTLYVAAFDKGNLIDSKEGEGLLKFTGTSSLSLCKDNSYLPLYDKSEQG